MSLTQCKLPLVDQGPPSVEAEKKDFGYLVLFSRVDKFRHFKMEIILMAADIPPPSSFQDGIFAS